MVVIGIQNQPGTVLMTVSDLTELNAEVQVAEADVLRVKVGQEATITLEALPEMSFRGRVTEVGASALPQLDAGAAAREFRVEIRLLEPAEGMRPGLTCDAEILVGERRDVVVVPLQAVVIRPQEDGSEARGVFTVSEGKARFVPVETGIIGGLDIEVDGISDQTEVIAGPYQALRRPRRWSLGQGSLTRTSILMTPAASSGSRRSPRIAGRVSLVEAVREGVGAVSTHPLRALLAGIAIAAAVATIATVVVALDGISRFARTNAARAFGSDTFVIAKVAAPGQVSRQELEQKLERNKNIRRADLRFLDRWAGGRVVYGATANARVEVAVGSRRYDGASLVAATSELAAIRDLAIERGRFFTPQEELQARQVVVLGATLVDELFPAIDPLGQTVRIAGRGFEVIGLQERQGTVAGSSLDRNVWIPLPTFERAFGAPETLQILARASTS